MSHIPRWGLGSRRRIRTIHWNRTEIATLIALAISLALFAIFLARLLTIIDAD